MKKPLKQPSFKITVGSRASPLSRAQVKEVEEELQSFYPGIAFVPIYMHTQGDLDQKTSLRTLDKTDFFTKEIDSLLLEGKCRIAIHSAKDLPEPLPKGLRIVALTKGVDPSDALVLKEGNTLKSLPPQSRIATSSLRREESVKMLRDDLKFVDIRGTIGQRLEKLMHGEIEGVVVAEAALIRLKLTHLNRTRLPGETVPLQGRLAVIARKEDLEMQALFNLFNQRDFPHQQSACFWGLVHVENDIS